MPDDPTSTESLILRMGAVARGLEDEGQYNIAKLLRAAIAGEIYRVSQQRPRQGDGLEEALREVVDDLANRDTTSESLGNALRYATDTFAQGGLPLLQEIPATFVCRYCGAVMIGERPQQCPHCGARGLTLQEIKPIYYNDPLSLEDLKQALRDNLADIERSVTGVSETEADRGVWPMRAIMEHLIGSQDLMISRTKRMLSEDNPVLASVAPTDIGLDASSGPPAMTALLEEFRATRLDLLELVGTLTASDLSRPGYHDEWGTLDVHSQLAFLVRHEQSHLAELEARRLGR